MQCKEKVARWVGAFLHYKYIRATKNLDNFITYIKLLTFWDPLLCRFC